MRVEFGGRDGNRIVGDAEGDAGAPHVLLLHGGGQTRQSWGGSLALLARAGYRAVVVDARGHGESEWATDGDYSLDAYAGDVLAIAQQLPSRPALAGASLGGLAALIATGESTIPPCWALVLVDVATRVDEEGAQRIRAFVRAHPDGFASVDDAADAVAAYLPHRARPPSPAGLMKNLRRGGDGRYYWHWDPARLAHSRTAASWPGARLDRAAAAVTVPTLLVYGGRSEIVTADSLEEFRRLLPSADLVEIPSAHHMVAGDENDAFYLAVRRFLDGVSVVRSPP